MWWSLSAPPAASASTPASADSHCGPACVQGGEQLFLLPPSPLFRPSPPRSLSKLCCLLVPRSREMVK